MKFRLSNILLITLILFLSINCKEQLKNRKMVDKYRMFSCYKTQTCPITYDYDIYIIIRTILFKIKKKFESKIIHKKNVSFDEFLKELQRIKEDYHNAKLKELLEKNKILNVIYHNVIEEHKDEFDVTDLIFDKLDFINKKPNKNKIIYSKKNKINDKIINGLLINKFDKPKQSDFDEIKPKINNLLIKKNEIQKKSVFNEVKPIDKSKSSLSKDSIIKSDITRLKNIDFTDSDRKMKRKCRLFENLCKSNHIKFCFKIEMLCSKKETNDLKINVNIDIPIINASQKQNKEKRNLPFYSKKQKIESEEIVFKNNKSRNKMVKNEKKKEGIFQDLSKLKVKKSLNNTKYQKEKIKYLSNNSFSIKELNNSNILSSKKRKKDRKLIESNKNDLSSNNLKEITVVSTQNKHKKLSKKQKFNGDLLKDSEKDNIYMKNICLKYSNKCVNQNILPKNKSFCKQKKDKCRKNHNILETDITIRKRKLKLNKYSNDIKNKSVLNSNKNIKGIYNNEKEKEPNTFINENVNETKIQLRDKNDKLNLIKIYF